MSDPGRPGYCAVDHLVIAAHSLAQGVAWCEASLGVTPGPGGQHPFMGTHNRLLRIDGAGFEACYLEIIAIDPAAPSPDRSRWFGLGDASLQRALHDSPRLLGAVLRTQRLDDLRQGLLALGQDIGPPLAAERPTPEGRLAWRIAVRDDGAWPGAGRLPTLIEWAGRHPTQAMAASVLQLQLQSLAFGQVSVPEAALLQLPAGMIGTGGPALSVRLRTPLGAVTLETP